MTQHQKEPTMPVQEVGELPELKSVRRAILVVDLVESVRLIQDHEADVIDRWRRFVSEVRTQVIAPRAGRMVRHLGDGMLLEFEDPHLAMGAALDIQHAMQRYNVGRDAAACMHLRVGAHLTEIKVDELDIFGPGVNLVARLAGLAAPGAIVCSAEFKEALVPWLDAEFEDLGDCWLKHIDRPVRAYRALAAARGLERLVAPGGGARPDGRGLP